MIALLNFGVHAQDEAEAVLMILDKESNWPMCRFSDQMKIHSEFVPENRIGDTDMVSTEEIRICEEEDVWNAVEEEMLVGMAIGTPSLPILLPMGIGGTIGCIMGYATYRNTTKGFAEPSLMKRLGSNTFAGGGYGIVGEVIRLILSGSKVASYHLKAFGLGALSGAIAGEICKEIPWYGSSE